MQALDEKLIDQLAATRADIHETERAEPPIEAAVVARLAEVEEAASRFREAPFVVAGDLRAASPTGVRAMALGMMATLLPDATRQLIETSTIAAEQRRNVPRLAPADKAAKLAALRAKAQRIEAALEIQRRALERDDPDTTFARAGFDAGIWLADDAELRTLAGANGRSR